MRCGANLQGSWSWPVKEWAPACSSCDCLGYSGAGLLKPWPGCAEKRPCGGFCGAGLLKCWPGCAEKRPCGGFCGAGLLKCCRPVPGIGPTGAGVAPACTVSADSLQKHNRPAPRLPQTCSTKAGIWAFYVAAFPQKRPSVRSGAKRGQDSGRNGHFRCRVSTKTAFCAFWRETWPGKQMLHAG